MGVGAVPYNVSNALAEEHHTRSAREKEREAEAGGVGSMVESESRRIVSMRIYLYLGDRANGDCLTASAPNWVSLTVNKQRQLTKALFHAVAEGQSANQKGPLPWPLELGATRTSQVGLKAASLGEGSVLEASRGE